MWVQQGLLLMMSHRWSNKLQSIRNHNWRQINDRPDSDVRLMSITQTESCSFLNHLNTQHVIAIHGSYSQQRSPKSNFAEKLPLQTWLLKTTSLFLNLFVLLLYLMFDSSRFPSCHRHLFTLQTWPDCLHARIYRLQCICFWIKLKRLEHAVVPSTQVCKWMFVGTTDSGNRIIELC